jgi:hypothetical protein
VGLVAGLGAVPAIQSIPTATAATSSAVNVRTFYPTLTDLGTVNFSQLSTAAAAAAARVKAAPAISAGWRVVDNHAATFEAKQGSSTTRAGVHTPVTGTNVKGESGFVGMTGYDQAVANGGVDLEPPDQGLCAGQGLIGEFINNSFSVYKPDGSHQLGVLPSYALFKQPSTAFMSDPRCHYDAPTQRWFLTEFVVGSSTAPSLQFIDVSNTSDPTGTYTVWSIDTTDLSNPGCPCFGDYDELGVDNNGVYITTDEFPDGPGGYNGVIMYAVSKSLLETFATTGIAPIPIAYRLTSDPFGQPYIVSPTSTPPGALFAPDTEYFVESNGDAFQDDHLMVYALNDTSLLASPGLPPPPSLYRVRVKSEPYSFPPDALQMRGPIPLGRSVQDPLGQLEADFDAVMQTTYVNGHVYAELDTGTASGNDAAAWFVLTPNLSSGGTLTATLDHEGYVAVNGASLIYPAIGVDRNGSGYMAFALSGTSYHPSAAYVAIGPAGVTGPVRIAMPGANPEDSFTCYAAFVGPDYGGCRWGDYSAAVAMGNKIYMATEMIPPTSRDYLTNWGTLVWSAPPGS